MDPLFPVFAAACLMPGLGQFRGLDIQPDVNAFVITTGIPAGTPRLVQVVGVRRGGREFINTIKRGMPLSVGDGVLACLGPGLGSGFGSGRVVALPLARLGIPAAEPEIAVLTITPDR